MAQNPIQKNERVDYLANQQSKPSQQAINNASQQASKPANQQASKLSDDDR
jgi:hypothetical protein